MLFIETLLRKNPFKKKNGDEIIDLTKASIEYNIDVPLTGYTVVTEEFIMRADLVAESALGNPSKLDYILKYNGISNPLSLDKGQILYIPDETEMAKAFKKPNEEQTPEKLEDKILKPKTQKDLKRLDLLKKKAQMDVVLPPNINKDNENNIVMTNDKIILGPNAKTNCPDNTTRARLKQNLLNKKIFG